MSIAPHHADLRARLATALSAPYQALLFQAANIAAKQQLNMFLVGGPVRDLILRRPLTDLDLVIEGDAWPVAEAFCAATGGKLTKHAAFRTAVVEVDVDGTRYPIDFVTARREDYPTPAALPVVTPSGMHDDLARRDFTVNAMALQILPDAAGELLDPFAGAHDIEAGMIRVLHERSFVDDPTRILRGARFASRLGFTLEPATHAQISAALAEMMLSRTSPQRILNELWLTLDEPQPEVALQLLHELGTFDQLALVWSNEWNRQFSAARSRTVDDVSLSDVSFGLLIWPMDQHQRNSFRTRYNLPGGQRKLLDELPFSVPVALSQSRINDFELEQALQPYSIVTLRTLQLVAPSTADYIEHYLANIRSLAALLSGDDLRAHGIAPGPQYRQILAELRQVQLLQMITTRDAALHWLEQRQH